MECAGTSGNSDSDDIYLLEIRTVLYVTNMRRQMVGYSPVGYGLENLTICPVGRQV
jgi:hypothetical protein